MDEILATSGHRDAEGTQGEFIPLHRKQEGDGHERAGAMPARLRPGPIGMVKPHWTAEFARFDSEADTRQDAAGADFDRNTIFAGNGRADRGRGTVPSPAATRRGARAPAGQAVVREPEWNLQ